ncbi:hypothetical protein Fmac_030105 [Flemingia macrophylla]|uniref:Uncharacterized protein n=1 Tax=Flemingia macrophylla TaxID=520843 RepID=A0ABD1LCE0_9FABA
MMVLCPKKDVSEGKEENITDDEKEYDDVEVQDISKLLSDHMMFIPLNHATYHDSCCEGIWTEKVTNNICCWCGCHGVFFKDKEESDLEKSEEQKALNKICNAETDRIHDLRRVDCRYL